MAFDYDAVDTPDEAVMAVVADMRGTGLTPLSDEECEQRWLDRQFWREECRQREEEMHLEYEHEQALKADAAQRGAAIAATQAREKAQRERREQINREVREKELRDLRFQVAQNQAWQTSVDTAARNVAAYQHRQTLMNELEVAINPPPPPPEPEIVYVSGDDPLGSPDIADENFNPGYWLNKPIFRR